MNNKNLSEIESAVRETLEKHFGIIVDCDIFPEQEKFAVQFFPPESDSAPRHVFANTNSAQTIAETLKKSLEEDFPIFDVSHDEAAKMQNYLKNVSFAAQRAIDRFAEKKEDISFADVDSVHFDEYGNTIVDITFEYRNGDRWSTSYTFRFLMRNGKDVEEDIEKKLSWDYGV